MSLFFRFASPLRLAALAACLAAGPAFAQTDEDLLVRLDQLQNQMRTLTGAMEQLQYRNQQLEAQVKRLQDDMAAGGRGAPPPAAGAAPSAGPAPATLPPAEPAPRGGVQRRSDAFDPSANPSAPGVPRALGSGAPVAAPATADNREVGLPGGREPGEPLDLANLSANAARGGDPSRAAPVAGAPVATASVAPPSQTPRDQFDLGYGFMLRKEFAQADEAFHDFLKRYPSDRLAVDAHYWLGESLFQRQRYRDAAESFLVVTTKYETSGRAPEALLRLGQSLAALGEKEAACAAMGEVVRKYPKAGAAVKQGVEREQKRARC